MFINSTYGGTSNKRRRRDFGRQSENIINNSIWCNSNSVAQFILMTEIEWRADWMRMDGWMDDWNGRKTWLLIIKLICRAKFRRFPVPTATGHIEESVQGLRIPYSILCCPTIRDGNYKLLLTFSPQKEELVMKNVFIFRRSCSVSIMLNYLFIKMNHF